MHLMWLTVVWVALWGSVTPANVLGGLVVGAVLLRTLPRQASSHSTALAPWGVLRFLAAFLVALVQSSAEVVRQVLRPALVLHPAVLAVPVAGSDDRLLVLLANSISLTPGTLTLEVDRSRRLLYVHVLDVGPDAAGLPQVRQSISRLERAAGRALGEAS